MYAFECVSEWSDLIRIRNLVSCVSTRAHSAVVSRRRFLQSIDWDRRKNMYRIDAMRFIIHCLCGKSFAYRNRAMRSGFEDDQPPVTSRTNIL